MLGLPLELEAFSAIGARVERFHDSHLATASRNLLRRDSLPFR